MRNQYKKFILLISNIKNIDNINNDKISEDPNLNITNLCGIAL